MPNANKNDSSLLLRKLTLAAILAAASIILCRYLGYSPGDQMYRVEIGFLPIAILAIFAGPVWSAAGYAVADLLGSLLTTGMNPLILLCKTAFGAVLGVMFYRKKPSLPRILLTFFLIGTVIDILCMSGVFVLMGYAPSFSAALKVRAVNVAVNYPIRVFAMWLLVRFGGRVFTKFGRYFGLKTTSGQFKTYANSFQAVSRLGLERVFSMLDKLGHPEWDLHCLHIAGTNGKGSVSMFLSAILRQAGYKTGLFTSPNLVKVNERIIVDGEAISDGDLEAILAEVEEAAEATEREMNDCPTQFEIWTAAAFLYFSRQKTDYVVLETGLGGEFDATNVIPSNVLSILTKIDLDHTQYLGDTIGKIATTKSKIIKSDCETGFAISAPQTAEAVAAIDLRCAEVGVKPVYVEVPAPERFEGIREIFNYREIDLSPSLGGVHQIENACIAAEAALRMGISEEVVKVGIASACHPARLELLSSDPVILYDGGHNPNGITSLNASLDRYYPGREMTVIFACMKDKDIAPSLRLLAEPGRTFVFTTVQNNPRALPAGDLCEKAASLGVIGEYRDTLAEAIAAAKEKGKMILICGSLYLYADLPEEYLFASGKPGAVLTGKKEIPFEK